MSKKVTNINERAQEKAFNAKIGVEAIEERQTLSSCKRLHYLEICNKAHESLTEALAELKTKSKQTVPE